MEEKKPNTFFKKFRKIAFRTFIALILLVLTIAILLTLPSVQTKVAHYFTEKINSDYGTKINVDQVAITVFGGVKLKKVIILDHHNDTLIYANRINTSIIDVNKLINGDLLFGTIRADSLHFKIKTYKGEKNHNLNKFITAFDKEKKSTHTFLMTSSKIVVNNSHFMLIDENKSEPTLLHFTKVFTDVSNFKINGPQITTNINQMSFKDHRGLVVKDLKANFKYSKTNIALQDLALKTDESTFDGDIKLSYKDGDFSDFSNKVIFNLDSRKAQIASNDIRIFYKDLEANKKINLKGKINGTLNNFSAKNLLINDSNNTEIVGDIVFKNLVQKAGKGNFYMKGKFDKVASSYNDLITLLPNVLGKKLPTSLNKLGRFNLVGNAEVTTTTLNTDFALTTQLGNVKSNLIMSDFNNSNNAIYKGNIDLDNFDLGSFLNRKDIGKVTLNIDVDGKGFTEKSLNTKFSGDINNLSFNGYNFKKIITDGSFKNQVFSGKLNINDPNLLLDFDGVVDISKKENSYDFHAIVDHINLKNLKFINDDIAVFRGDVVIKANGNSINNLKGDILITNASYQNPKDIYYFDSINVNSSFDSNNERTISFYSPNAIKGEIQGKFEFDQIPAMIQNSLGSLYANYRPNYVKKGQYIKFNLAEFNKVVEIVYPQINLADKTILNGYLNSDGNEFKMNFNSSSIKGYDVELDNVQIEIDNKNPLYNAYIQLDSIKTKYYKVRDFSLINVTSKDTLYVRSEFKGGTQGNDFYNLNLFHTINSDNKNVVGFTKSEMMFKDYVWNINEQNDEKNKIVFDKKLTNFNFEDIIISHENQSITLNGLLNGTQNKDIQLTFDNVNLNKVTPEIQKFKFNGFIDGNVNIKQNNSVYQPTANITINKLDVNDNFLGNLNLEIEGDENFRKFNINSTLENENFESFNAIGNLEVVNNQTVMDLVLNFKKFNLGILSNLGGNIITNIRGKVNGSAQLSGNLNDINYNGRLFVEDTGLTIPYLNVDYTFVNNSIIDVTKNKFIILPTNINDTKFSTSGNIEGFIKHDKFSKWELNLDINTKKFLVLNTQDQDDAAYYGTAFMNGKASIYGPTNGLVINVEAKSEKGTDIKIPINDAQSVGSNDYLHFITPNEKYNLGNKDEINTRRFNGLELNFDLDITQDANIEVILDRNSGHGMKGNGRGGLLFRINTFGKFEMYGDYQVYQGTYRFKYGGIIDKPFEVKKFSSISWEGDPLKAILNLEAVYKTTANPAILVENSSVNRKVDVDVTIGVKGTLSNPEPDFDISFPKVSSILKSEIETKLDDPATRQTQALALLSTGSFVTANTGGSVAYGSLFETAGGLFSDLFNDKDGKFKVGFDYTQADRTPGIETDGQVGVTLTTKINERITINGKVGVPVGGINESAIVGNVELEYRVNEDGTLNLRVFNRENDINYIGQGIGYTQGVGITYEVDFDTFKELVNKIFTKHKIDVIKDPEIINDKDYLPDYIKLNKSKKNNKDQTTNNKDAIKPKDE